MKDFKWRAIGDDDFICNPCDDYSLRVERMTKTTWWWSVYFKDNQIITKKDMILKCSQSYAMGLCEGVYLGHLSSNKK